MLRRVVSIADEGVNRLVLVHVVFLSCIRHPGANQRPSAGQTKPIFPGATPKPNGNAVYAKDGFPFCPASSQRRTPRAQLE